MFGRPNSVHQARNPTEPAPKPKDADTKDLEARVSNSLGLRVEVVDKGKRGGEVRITYKTLEQLDDVIHRLTRN